MVDLTDTPIAEKLERYRQLRGFARGSPQWSQLVMDHQRNPSVFTELLEKELTRLQKTTNGGSPK